MSRRIAVLLVAQIAAAVASAGEVRTRGLAPLDNQSRGAARLQAIQDAERRAAELPGMRIMGNSRSDASAPPRFRRRPAGGNPRGRRIQQ